MMGLRKKRNISLLNLYKCDEFELEMDFFLFRAGALWERERFQQRIRRLIGFSEKYKDYYEFMIIIPIHVLWGYEYKIPFGLSLH